MYSLVLDQEVQDTGYLVAESGAYQPFDLVPCRRAVDSEATCAFLAIYIATGVNE